MLEKLAAEAAKWQPGDPLDPATRMGSMVDETQMERVLGYIGTGAGEGAELRLGGGRAREETGGFYVEPTIFGGARNDMRIAQRGDLRPGRHRDPVRLRGGRRCGSPTTRSTASPPRVWTRDINKAHRFARSIRAGTVCINCYDWGDNSLPFGGYKQSGIGRDKSLHALENYTQLKTTYINVLDD